MSDLIIQKNIIERTISDSISDSTVYLVRDYVFRGCSSLTNVSFPSCCSIGISAFQDCSILSSASFPMCTHIGNSAFMGCTSLKFVNFSSSSFCTLENSGAFSGTGITSSSGTIVVNPYLINSYNSNSQWSHFFSRLSYMEGYYSNRTLNMNTSELIANGYINVSDGVLLSTSLTSSLAGGLFWNNQVTTVGSNAFKDCVNLDKVNFPGCTQISNNAFQGCTSLSEVNFPVCSSIGSYAFQSASISSIDLSNCTYIGSYAFDGCNVNSAYIMSYCSYIGEGAFNGCSNLSEIKLDSSVMCVLDSSNAFNGTGITSTTGKIKVPKSLLSSYQADPQWSYFYNIINPLELPTKGQIITMALEESGTQRNYRVLKQISDTVVEVFGLFSTGHPGTGETESTPATYTTYSNGESHLNWEGSLYEQKLLNFYNNFSDQAKSAIQPAEFKATCRANGTNIPNTVNGTKSYGLKNIYEPTAQTLIDYYGASNIPGSNTAGLARWWWNQDTAKGEYPGIAHYNSSSASRTHYDSSSSFYWYAESYKWAHSVRPVMQIDLSKIDFEVVS